MKNKKKIKIKEKIGKEGLSKHRKEQFKKEQKKLIDNLKAFVSGKLDIQIP